MRSLRLLAISAGLAATAASVTFAAPTAPAAPAAPAKSAPAAANPLPAPAGVQPEALQALRSMSAYLATVQSAKLTSKTSLDVVTMAGQRVQLDGVVNYQFRRPNGFRIEVVSDRKRRTFYYDGKKFTVYSPDLGYYATVAAPPTIRETLAAIESKFGIELPLEDLFRWNDATNNPAEKLTSGFHVGTATVDGVVTDQYAFRQPNVDWQIWIKRGAQPLPVKVIIVDQVDPAKPAYTARLTWNVSPTLAANDFTFRPAQGAKPIRLSEVAK